MGAALGNKKSRRSRRQMSEINVTPFVDVMLVLLVIFMVAAPLMTTGIQVDLPKAASEPISTDKEPITIFINKKEQLSIGKHLVEPSELADKLIAITKGNRKERIFVKAGRAVPYGTVVAIMARVNKEGYNKVALITDIE